MIQTNKLLTFFFIKASSKRFIGGVCSRQIDNIFTNFKKKKKNLWGFAWQMLQQWLAVI